MGHTAEDWSGGLKATTVFSVKDLGELAARLGSVVTFDRRGNVLFLDNFEDGYGAWIITTYGTGAVQKLSVERKRSGSYSLLLYPGTDGGKALKIVHPMPYPVLSMFGFEMSVEGHTDIGDHTFGFILYDGTNSHSYTIKYLWSDNKIQVWTAAGAYTDVVTDLDLATQEKLFHVFKIVVDLENGAYVRLIADNVEYDISAYGPQVAVDASAPQIHAHLQARQAGTGTTWLRVDDVIVTHNEP